MTSRNGYGAMSINASDLNEEEKASLVATNGSKNEDWSLNDVNKKVIGGAVVLLVVLIGGAVAFKNSNGALQATTIWDDIKEDISQARNGRKFGSAKPLSTLDPVKDLNLHPFNRSKSSRPARPLTANGEQTSYPTNSWYQSLLMPESDPSSIHRTYSIPYLVDASGPFPGIQLHPNHIDASSSVVQMSNVDSNGLTLGVATASKLHAEHKPTQMYNVSRTTPIGLTLEWNAYPMSSTITYGMPYATMQFKSIGGVFHHGDELFPTVGSSIELEGLPVADGRKKMKHGTTVHVEREIEMLFKNSDFTWILFTSEPVKIQYVKTETGGTLIQVLEFAQDDHVDRDLIIRIALAKQCSTGKSAIYCHPQKMHPTALQLGQGHYETLLRNYANFFPGPETTFNYEFSDDGKTSTLVFDWDVKSMSDSALHPLPPTNETGKHMIGFALPHQFDSLVQVPPSDHDLYCVASLVGPACLYEGSVWELIEKIPEIGFRAPRSPAPWSIPFLTKSLQDDIKFTLPEFYNRGAGDTYFSGKMLAKLSRIVLIADEVSEICDHKRKAFPAGYEKVCRNEALPSAQSFEKALATLRSSVEVWVNGTAEIPFVYDSAWGGVASCGCDFDGEKEVCKNTFPDCPGFEDPGLNFGNAFYNDMHFHYGYFIYAAAVVARFDPSWGIKMFEPILLLIRCIANPSEEDPYFSIYKYKDWYRGHSWASGIAMVFLNGKNQESSSEAIAAYEGIALFGDAMASAFADEGLASQVEVAKHVKQLGAVLTATEVKSARRYWHLESKDGIKVFPTEYSRDAVGMLWQCMAQLQTWFGSAPYLAYGIQLLPLTPIAEFRDSISWSETVFHTYAETCGNDPSCVTNGWSVLQYALLATIGHQEEAASQALSLPLGVFESAGGNGHSLTNTLWYTATRPLVANPFPVNINDTTTIPLPNAYQPIGVTVKDCGRPKTCTDFVLDTIAGLYSCRQRIEWLMGERGQSEDDACYQVAGVENPDECGGCNPDEKDHSKHHTPVCPLCTPDECKSDLNRCPAFEATFVCSKGLSIGGCTSWPWTTPSVQCEECCELTHCAE